MAETCAHEGCTCEAREDGYCSDYCAQPAVADEGSPEAAHDHEGHTCHCGHAVCDASATAPA